MEVALLQHLHRAPRSHLLSLAADFFALTKPRVTLLAAFTGALPPMIGWAATTGEIGFRPFTLFLIIFLWTPPHFWALSLNRADEYVWSGVLMLPVAAGRAETTLRSPSLRAHEV